MLDRDYPYTKLEDDTIQYYNGNDRCYRCPICEKVFYTPESAKWTYRMLNAHDKLRMMCSWTCYRKAERELLIDKTDGRRRVIKYPQDFPKNWKEVYKKWKDMAITTGEAARLLELSGYRAFNVLKDCYEEYLEEVI